MARLPYLEIDDASEPVRGALEALPALNIFRMLAHAETAFGPYLRLGGAILGELELDPKLRELAILQVAKEGDAEYEWVQHVVIGRLAGVDDEQIAAIEGGHIVNSAAFDQTEKAVLELAAAMVRGPRVDQPTFDALRKRLSPREIVELLLTIGNYLMLARVMTVLELEIDPAIGNTVVDQAKSLLDGQGAPIDE
jgi:4-carboxymuconolactone decarboxylase